MSKSGAPVVGVTIGRLVDEDGRGVDGATTQYSEAVARAGGVPLLVPTTARHRAAEVVQALDGLLITGGGDIGPERYQAERAPQTAGVDHDRDEAETTLLALARQSGLPVLGICRGCQVINVALGGSLHQHLAPVGAIVHDQWDQRHQAVHAVEVVPESLLGSVTKRSRLQVNSAHHQGLDRVAPGLLAVATAPDGLVEALQHPDRDLLAVQWHPELIMDVPGSSELFAWLVSRAAERA